MPMSSKPMFDWAWGWALSPTWPLTHMTPTWLPLTRATCLPRTPRGSASGRGRCYGNTCMTSRSCWRRTWIAGSWIGRTAPPTQRRCSSSLLISSCLSASALLFLGQIAAAAVPGCPARPAAGGLVGEPEDLRSVNGELHLDLSYRTSVDAQGETHFCYVSSAGKEAPTLRVKPGDLLVMRLTNAEPKAAGPAHKMKSNGCTTGTMTASATK